MLKLATQHLLIIITFYSFAFAERKWLNDTGLFFDASFESISGKTVKLKSTDGRIASFPINSLSVVDRLYLIDKHQIPESDVLDGFIENQEDKFRIKRTLVKKIDSMLIETDEEKIKFQVYQTPRFEFWLEEKIDHAAFGELIEKIWFYNSWRHEKYRNNYTLRDLIILTSSEEGSKTLARWVTENHPNLAAENKSQLMSGWGLSRRSIPVPPSIAAERGLNRAGYINRNDEADVGKENFEAVFVSAYTRFIRSRYDGSNKHMNHISGKGRFFCYALGFDSEAGISGQVYSSMATDIGNAGELGSLKEISKEIIKKFKAGEAAISVNDLFSTDYSLSSNNYFVSKLVAISRFLHSNMKLELGTAKFQNQLSYDKVDFEAGSLATSCGFTNIEEMDKALKKGNLK